MTRGYQVSVRCLLAVVLVAASFFAGLTVNKRETDDLRATVKVEQASNAKISDTMRQPADELIGAKSRINELDGQENIAAVSADDLNTGGAVVIGRLGSPLKTMLPIRGTWQRSRVPKYRGLLFHVTHVNGKSLDKPVVFYHSVVHVRYPLLLGDGNETKSGPTPADGRIWEIRAYETGEFVENPPEYNDELGMLLPYIEQATPWPNFKLELHGIIQEDHAYLPDGR